MISRSFTQFLFALLLATVPAGMLFAQNAQTNTSSPYGTCAHLGGGMEFDAMPDNLNAMAAAGIRWARADFSWTGVERGKGNWYFQHLDRVLDEADKAGITVLPILNYDTPWASPAYKHLDEWSGYVRKIVTRYKDRIRYWEVWNEENLRGFWRDTPRGEDYALLLKRTAEIIRSIDPDLKIVYGGLAGVPADFYEKSLKAGAGDYFDVVNIHPYRGGLISMGLSERFVADVARFDALTKQYTGVNKPIWITEMGWATPPKYGESGHKVVDASLKILFPKGMTGAFALLCDNNYERSLQVPPAVMESTVPAGVPTKLVSLAELKGLDPGKFPCLLLPAGEMFPTPYFDDLVQYVHDGGTLFLLGGVPLYYLTTADSQGVLSQSGGAPERYRQRLRIGWTAWWTAKGTPETAPVVVAEAAQAALAGFQPVLEGTRFLNDSRLKPGDRFIPLLDGQKGDFTAPVAAIFRFNSDFKGEVVVSTLMDQMGSNISSVENQGVFLPQAYLLAFAAGVERYFWYEFQAVEQDDIDKEHHFGMVHRDLTPKPGYSALKVLTSVRPAGSVAQPGWSEDGVCLVRWTCPNGKRAAAIWAPGMPRTVDFKFDWKKCEIVDYLGNVVKTADEPNPGTINVSPKILYVCER